MSETPWKIWRHAPLLGEHNDYVYREVLGLLPEEIERLAAQRVFSPSGSD